MLFDLLSFLCIQLSSIQTVALNMGFHVWDGLATFPCDGREHTPPDYPVAEEQSLFQPARFSTKLQDSICTSLGDRSPWSQVQVRPQDLQYKLLGGAVGVRVDTAPPGVSEASAKNGGIFPVQQVQQLSGIKKEISAKSCETSSETWAFGISGQATGCSA